MLDTEEAVATAAFASSGIARVPSRREVLNVIIREAQISRTDAGMFLAWMKYVVREDRKSGYMGCLLTEYELCRYHPTLEVIIPDDTFSKVGSAHRLMEGFLLDPTAGELTIMHTMRDAGGARYCTVLTSIGVFGR